MDEKETQKALNAQVNYEGRNNGADAALKVIHGFNEKADARQARDRQNAQEGMASNRLMVGFKGGWGWRPATNAGRRTVTSTATKDGVRGLLESVYYDGELQSETFKPCE